MTFAKALPWPGNLRLGRSFRPRGTQAFADKRHYSAVHINSMTVHDETALPFGGINRSGWGRFNAAEGMEEFLVTKSVTWDD